MSLTWGKPGHWSASLIAMDPLDLIHDLSWDDLPDPVRRQARLAVLDLAGIAVGGATTDLSGIIRTHAAHEFGGSLTLPFDTRQASPAGYALALGMTIDALDGHDGYNPAKGHVGCGLLPAILAFAQSEDRYDGRETLTSVAIGYELGSRLAVALHGSVPDYHTSGAWIAVAAAAAGARAMGLSREATRHALGIAEYHGPRSQMMRCIDHPTMLKDGSGWGAMAGVSAARLARDGFTGAPALTVEEADVWDDLGTRWLITEQYFKPYPVCRWAQAPVEAVLDLAQRHDLSPADVAAITIDTFHEATRLATSRPQTTEEAQYSTSFPVAVALARGQITADDLQGPALFDPEILRLSDALTMREDATANARFPAERLARATLQLRDGREISGDWHTPLWDAEHPPTEEELKTKFRDLTHPVIGEPRATALMTTVDRIETDGARPFIEALAQPISSSTIRGSAA